MDFIEEEKLIRISALVLKEMQGRLTGEERIFLDSWLKESALHTQIYQRCLSGHKQREAYASLRYFETQRNFDGLKAKIAFPSKTRTVVLRRLWPIVAAASVLIAISGIWFWNKGANQQLNERLVSINDRLPASNLATITLSDGRQYQLNKTENKVVIDSGGIHYSHGDQVAAINAAVSAKIETPRGGTYDVTLPDGTNVKLNAGTILTYPTVFAKDKREVTLLGEAYFEVAKRKDQPFIVHSKNQQVRVLGTHFNINAYQTSAKIKTTLLEGKVTVKELNRGHQVTLLPGDQAVNSAANFSKRAVNVQQEMAWVYGKFNFDGKSLREVMDELSQWYAIDVVYKGDIPEVEFFGGTFRTSKLSTILKILKDQDLSYQLTDDGKLIIKKNASNIRKGGQ
ncbi:FecR family protein [Sphingobacterium detergens]|uniref:FecR family protein n=1 Tax=Sphingobacterium detergens TaxID=1145106 RepID=UPI003AAF9060